MENKRINGIIPTKNTKEKQKRINYKKLALYYTKSLMTTKYIIHSNIRNNKDGVSKSFIISYDEFDRIFQNGLFNFSDMMYLFLNIGIYKNTEIFDILLSDSNVFSTDNKYTLEFIDSHSKRTDKVEYINFSTIKQSGLNNNYEIIQKRQLFTLAFLSLVKDYFNTYDTIYDKIIKIKNKKILNEYEQLIVNLFNNIFSIETKEFKNEKIINMFKKMKNISLNSNIQIQDNNLLEEYINNTITRTVEINEQINKIKEQILGCYLYNYNDKEQNKDWIINFLNTCGTETINYKLNIKYQNENENDILQQDLNQYNNFWINCQDGFCYTLNEFINTQLNGNKEQFFFNLGTVSINCQNGIPTIFCDNNNIPLDPNFIFNELYKFEENNINYLNKFNEGIQYYYQQQILTLQNQYNQLNNISNQINQIQNFNNTPQTQPNQLVQYEQNGIIYNNTNQQISQNLNNAIGMFGNVQGIGQSF